MPGSVILCALLASGALAQLPDPVPPDDAPDDPGGLSELPRNGASDDPNLDNEPRDEKIDNDLTDRPNPSPRGKGPRTAPTRGGGSSGTPLPNDPFIEDAGERPFDPAPGTLPSSAAPGRTPQADPAEPATETGRRAQSSFKRAKGLAEGFLRDVREREDLPQGGRPAPSAPSDAASLDPSRPATARELAVSYESGFRPYFEARGLRVAHDAEGRAAVVRRDGAPAAPAEVAAVVSAINEAPTALLKRPDFFAVLAPQGHAALKAAYRDAPGSADFRHVALDAGERDFLWEESCTKVAGSCNPHARESSYKRGEQVSPETLDAIWASLKEGPSAAAALAAEKLGRRRFDLGAALSRVMGVFGSVLPSIAGGSADEPRPGAEAEGRVSADAGQVQPGSGGAELSARSRRRSGAAVPPPPGGEAASWPWYLLLAFAGAALALWGLWYRRRSAIALLMMAGLTGTLQAAEPCRARQPLWGVETGKEDQPSCGGTEDGLCAALKASLVEGSESPGPRRIGEACAGDSAGTEFWRALDNRVAVLQQGHCGDADSAGRVSSELKDLGEALGLRDAELERARKRLLQLERGLPPAEAEAASARLEPLLARLESRRDALKSGEAGAADLAAWAALEPHARRLLACAEGTPTAGAFAKRFQLIAPLLLVSEHLHDLAGGDPKKAAELREAHFGGDGFTARGLALAERLMAAADYRFAREREAAAKGDKPRERSLPEDIPERLYKAAPRYVEFLMELTGSSRRGHPTLEHRLIAAAQELKRRSGDRAPNEAIGALVYGTHDPALAALIESAKTGSLEAWSKRVDEGLDGLATWTVPCYEAAKEAVKDRHEYSWEMGLGCVPAGPIGKVALKGGVKVYRAGRAAVLSSERKTQYASFARPDDYRNVYHPPGSEAARLKWNVVGRSEPEARKIADQLRLQRGSTCTRHALTAALREQGRDILLGRVLREANRKILRTKANCVKPSDEGMWPHELSEELRYEARVVAGRPQAQLEASVQSALADGKAVVAVISTDGTGKALHSVSVLRAGHNQHGAVFGIYEGNVQGLTYAAARDLKLHSVWSISAPPDPRWWSFYVNVGMILATPASTAASRL